jgi:mono/diheme cytochrome c family protein
MRLRSTGAAVAALAVAALGSPAVGQAPAPRGEAIYAERCKECHESGDERAPQRSALAAKPVAEIVAALTTGPMVPMAEGLTPEDKQAVAAFLTAH